MKTSVLTLSAVILLASCNPSPNKNITIEKMDSTASLIQQDSLNVAGETTSEAESEEKTTSLPAKKNETEAPAVKSNRAENSSESMSSSSGNEAKKKKGWSKTAKGAVIGGVVGAGTGAAVSKKNRLKGAAIGGAIGAGAGVLIGHDMDKKDGRH